MFGCVQRFRTVSNQPFLDRRTVRRGGGSFSTPERCLRNIRSTGFGPEGKFRRSEFGLEFAAFEREKMRLHIFRAESGAISNAPRKKA